MIQPPGFLVLASVEAMRPVFMIVMGGFLLLVAWRLSARMTGASRLLIRTGALLLALGYGVVVPMYEARVAVPLERAMSGSGNLEAALGWQLAKLFAMNGGWALAGLGIALHARLFETARARSTRPATAAAEGAATSSPLHETAV